MKIRNLLDLGKKYVVSAQSEILLSNLLGISPFELFENLDYEVDKKVSHKYLTGLLSLKNGKSKEKVIDHLNFCGNKFFISDCVLTPHIQTQEITYKTIELIKKIFYDDISVLDMCCGSGVIGLSIKKEIPNAKVTIADISLDALKVAKYNSEYNKLNVDVIHSDLFSNINNKFDVIVCNPPYLENPSKNRFLFNEPLISMEAGANGYEFYYKLLKQIRDYLKEKYLIVLEFGEGQKEKVNQIAKELLIDAYTDNLESFKGKSRSSFILNGKDDIPIMKRVLKKNR